MAEKPEPRIPAAGAASGEDGDGRVPYGYGHRAHRPDPDARYGFDPGPPRILPSARPAPVPDADVVIWKRPMR